MSTFLTTEPLIRLGTTLLHFVWQGALIAVVAWCILLLLRSASLRYVVGCAAMSLMLAAPIATFYCLTPARSFPPPAAAMSPDPIPTAMFIASPQTPFSLSPQPISSIPYSSVVGPWLAGFWLCGITLLLAHHTIGLAQLARLRRRCGAIVDVDLTRRLRRLADALHLRRPIALLESIDLDAPAVIGWLRPAILWPAAALGGLTPAQVDALLAHELAHIRRHDYLVNLLQTLVETLLFYHPAVWWLSDRIRREREYCCDDIAAQLLGDRILYATSLAQVEIQRHPPRLILAANGGPLMQRIRRLLPSTTPSAADRRPLVALLAVMALTLTGLVWASADEPPATTQPAAAPAEFAELTPDELRLGKQDDTLGRMVLLYQGHVEGLKRARQQSPENPTHDAVAEKIQRLRAAIAARMDDFESGKAEPKRHGSTVGLIGEYLMMGDDVRAGLYSMGPKPISLQQTLISAGFGWPSGFGEAEKLKLFSIQIVRTLEDAEHRRAQYVFTIPMANLLEHRADDIMILPDDQIRARRGQPQPDADRQAAAPPKPATTWPVSMFPELARTEPVLAQLVKNRDQIAAELETLTAQHGPDSPIVQKHISQLRDLHNQIDMLTLGLAIHSVRLEIDQAKAYQHRLEAQKRKRTELETNAQSPEIISEAFRDEIVLQNFLAMQARKLVQDHAKLQRDIIQLEKTHDADNRQFKALKTLAARLDKELPALQPQETISIYYVTGDVKRPGPVPFSGKEITLAQALESAGIDPKNTPDGKVELVRLPRNDPVGSVRTLTLRKAFDPLNHDTITIQPRDVISVTLREPPNPQPAIQRMP